MSTSTGAITGSIFHARIAGPVDQLSGHIKFYPPYISRTTGKKVPMKAEFQAYVNSLHGTNQKTGEPGRVDRVKVVVVGKRALTVCKYCGVGKMFSGTYTLNSYTGVVYRPDGQPEVRADGSKIMTQKVSLSMDEFLLGDDAPNAIAMEIQYGLRPQNWNVPNHPDQKVWDSLRAQRKAMTWDGQSKFFGFASVYPVDGQILPLTEEIPTMTGFANANANVNAGASGFGNVARPNANGFAPTPAPVANGFATGAGYTPAGNNGFAAGGARTF